MAARARLCCSAPSGWQATDADAWASRLLLLPLARMDVVLMPGSSACVVCWTRVLKVKAELVAPKGCHISHLAHHVLPPTFLTAGQSNCSGRRPRGVQPSRYNSRPLKRLVFVIVFSKRSSTGWCSFLQTPGPLALGTAEESFLRACIPATIPTKQDDASRGLSCLKHRRRHGIPSRTAATGSYARPSL